MRRLGVFLGGLLLITLVACGEEPRTFKPLPSGPVPDTFRVAFETTKGRFVIEAYRAWAPIAVRRFYELASIGAFDDNAFYRVIPNFVVQFGTPGDPKLTATLDSVKLPDEPRIERNLRGTVAFAQEGSGTRSHSVFINRRNADHLDTTGFVPFGRVVEGMAVIDSIQWPYRERPDHHLIATIGNKYLQRMYPKADYIRSATVLR
ncbi:MAG TPA: peptidylprolyl isomerase [Gemmatimonadaceae bacterium]|nr:peptidylprolyl isomerase [Gemmatimonadaceae bacterium]